MSKKFNPAFVFLLNFYFLSDGEAPHEMTEAVVNRVSIENAESDFNTQTSPSSPSEPDRGVNENGELNKYTKF